ncbi:MAG: hypothetical protein ACFHWX_02560 [Bacteroidota bacterium]
MMKQFLTLLALIVLTFGCEEGDGITDKTERDQDDLFLEQLYQDIVTLSESVVCEDPEKWAFTAIGNKGCGGPTGYIAYPTTINVDDFLAQVTFFSEQQKKYNEKWGIGSTCDVPSEPNGIVCEEGEPVFTYEN